MDANKRIGIIDIGSNSVRLVIYEVTSEGAHRVIDENKKSARLSERIAPDGTLPDAEIDSLAQTLLLFKMLCDANGTSQIRAVATAAIRNAANSRHIAERLEKRTGLRIEILSGEEEARYGFLGMINAMDVRDGFLVDIGGGSTEVTLFRDRRIVRSVSFPFGAVNTAKKYTRNGEIDGDAIDRIREMVKRALAKERWMDNHEGLPLVGLGGTIRSLGKMVQRKIKYSLPMAHNFEIFEETADSILEKLAELPVGQRSKIDGIAKDRTDIIVPGLLILQTLFRHVGASHYRISGTGVRDGLFYETRNAGLPEAGHAVDNVLEYSVRNLLSLHPFVPLQHVEQVNRLALRLFDGLRELHHFDAKARSYVHAASLLYRIGVTVNFYTFPQHTFYLMAHSRLDGLSHREILICAMAASFKSKNRTRQIYLQHKDILDDSDFQLAVRLGMLTRLAIALDRSETQAVTELKAVPGRNELSLRLQCRSQAEIERREVAALEKDFKKVWDLTPRCEVTVSPVTVSSTT